MLLQTLGNHSVCIEGILVSESPTTHLDFILAINPAVFSCHKLCSCCAATITRSPPTIAAIIKKVLPCNVLLCAKIRTSLINRSFKGLHVSVYVLRLSDNDVMLQGMVMSPACPAASAGESTVHALLALSPWQVPSLVKMMWVVRPVWLVWPVMRLVLGCRWPWWHSKKGISHRRNRSLVSRLQWSVWCILHHWKPMLFCVQGADIGRNHGRQVLVLLRKGISVTYLIVNVLSLLVWLATVEMSRLWKSSKDCKSHHWLVLDSSNSFLRVYSCQVIIVDLHKY